MKTFQVSMPDEVTQEFEDMLSQMMAKMGEGTKKGEALAQFLPAIREALAGDLPASTKPYVQAINGYLTGISAQVQALVSIVNTSEEAAEAKQTEALRAINEELTTKAEELAAAIAERDKAFQQLAEVQAQLAESQQYGAQLFERCEELVKTNNMLQTSYVKLAAALGQQAEE